MHQKQPSSQPEGHSRSASARTGAVVRAGEEACGVDAREFHAPHPPRVLVKLLQLRAGARVPQLRREAGRAQGQGWVSRQAGGNGGRQLLLNRLCDSCQQRTSGDNQWACRPARAAQQNKPTQQNNTRGRPLTWMRPS